MSNRLRTILIGVITGVWIVNAFLPTFVSTYKSSPEINGVFTLVVGALVASYGKKNGDDDKKGEGK